MFGLLLGLPTLRLRADYFAIITIAAAEILRFLIRSHLRPTSPGGLFGIQRFADSRDLNPYPDAWGISWRFNHSASLWC